MSAPARLLGLRLQGFKSFAERTLVDFGPGISAVVGPNGSGKSNLADGLRWALGEQGRSLRTRKSEDVIWAGSDRRAAQGMADVTLVLDNADSLLPVDFGIVELGRRLYRSGENDYLLNKQRVRLRDLVDLLDSAHLAENAFLFIGQGMVDQALALRPEERRPLFEEVAGVRRHERRRRKAEDQLAESEANLARVEDVVAELRPQARRLGQLAEQQATRLTAGEELAEALLLAAHARWHEAAGRAAAARSRRDAGRAEVDRSLVALEEAERVVAAIAAELEARAGVERDRRAAHEAARAEVTALRLQEARTGSELEAVARDRARLEGERATAEADLELQRRALAVPLPARDVDLEGSLGDAERALAEALGELGGLRAAERAQGEELSALRRAEAARIAEAETARRRLADTERRAEEARAQAATSEQRRVELEARLADARTALAGASAAAETATTDRLAALAALEAAEGRRQAASERAVAAGAAHAAGRGRVDALLARLDEDEARGIARAARKLGGTRVDEDLVVDPALRAAVEAALGELARGYVLPRARVGDVARERGALVVKDARPADDRAGHADVAAVLDAIRGVGGGPLGDAVRRDPADVVRPLLELAGWVPDLDAALTVQPALTPGWLVVVRDGSAIVDARTVRLGRGDSPLERRAEADRLAREVERLATEAAAATDAVTEATTASSDARAALDTARERERAAATERQAAETAERTVGRELEGAVREAVWQAAQVERLRAEAVRASVAVDDVEAAEGDRQVGAAVDGATDRSAMATWEARAAELRARRDRLAADHAQQETARREAEGRHARAEGAVAMDERRIEAATRELAVLAEREAAGAGVRADLAIALAAAAERETRALAELEALLAADAGDRARLGEAERAATAARERLRAAEDRLRSVDVADLEARLGLESLREQSLVELAGLGEVGIRHLEAAAGVVSQRPLAGPPVETGPEGVAADDDAPDDDASDDDPGRLERALAAVAPSWASEAPSAEPPGPGRLATLRRRFHELGAANPFAVEEYHALRERLTTLEGQTTDLKDAIVKTRQLIAELDELIATRFRTTFAQLESAFDVRFRQLFGGGFAKLSLTDPTDLSATGIEIVARPPGKKAQALSMLSGGERALTAVALLFAMLEVRPVPFCVLDEVDAALDEANVGRFTQALRELAERTQFIVITHNRGTIEAADALYGVTVGDDSVSRVISLRLEEAQALAARQRGTSADPLAVAG